MEETTRGNDERSVISMRYWLTAQQSRRSVLRLIAGTNLGVAGFAAIGEIAAAAPNSGSRSQVGRFQEDTSLSQLKPKLGKRADGTTVWRVRSGAKDMANGRDAMTFLPQMITINAGDAVLWDSSGDMEEFHIASFRSGRLGPLSTMPNSAVKGQLIANPLVAYLVDGATYNGTGYVNSGLPTNPGETLRADLYEARHLRLFLRGP